MPLGERHHLLRKNTITRDHQIERKHMHEKTREWKSFRDQIWLKQFHVKTTNNMILLKSCDLGTSYTAAVPLPKTPLAFFLSCHHVLQV